MKLTELTPEQEALIPVVREKWLKIGLSVDKSNRTTAVEGVKRAYEAVGLKPPKHFIWLESPFAGCVGAFLFTKVGEPKSNKSTKDTVDPAKTMFTPEAIAKIADSVISQMTDPKIAAELRQIADGDISVDEIRSQAGYAIYGNHEASWLSFYDYFLQLGFDCCKQLEGLMQVAQNSGWWWPFEEVVVMTERPNILKLDEQNRLHSGDTPAIGFPDDFKIYSIHGVRIPNDIIENPASVTVDRIKTERNAEIKRIMRERYGELKYLTDIKAKIVDVDSVRAFKDGDKEIEILRTLMEDDEKRRYLIGSDGSTSRVYHMEVAPTVKTCKEAHEFLSGFKENKIIAQS